MSTPKYDWNLISKEYIQGIKVKNAETNHVSIHFPTYAELADKYGCARETIGMRSAREKWSIQREQYCRKIKYKNTEIKTEDLLGISSKFDSVLISNLENLAKITTKYLEPYIEMIDQQERIDSGYNTSAYGDGIYEDLPRLTPKDIKDLIQAQKEIHTTVRSILGESQTESLLDDARNALIDARQRNGKKVSKAFLESELKRIQEIKKHEAELEMRREEIKQQLKMLKDGDK